MPHIKINEKQRFPRPYWPPELKSEGFVGNLQILNDSFTAVILHPAASLEQVKRSLELKIKDLELRIEKAKVAAGNGEK